MKRKFILRIVFVMLCTLLPLIPWYFLGPTKNLPITYENITHAFGQITALVGMTLFAFTFVLSTRLKWIESFFGGLDKVYRVHAIFGGSAFMLLLFHPLFLVLKYVPSQLHLASKYLLPGHGFSVDLGIIALSGMIILLCFTFYINIKYHIWKLSHKLFGIIFIIGIFHTILIRGNGSRDIIFNGYYVYVIIVSLIGLISFIYSLFFKSIRALRYKVVSIKMYGHIYDIRLVPIRKYLHYDAGQFAFFRFHNKVLGKEYHPFSLASHSNDEHLRIIAKSLGDYTSKLHVINVGDLVSVEGPYGRFTLKKSFDDMIWFAAGIGITPFIGLAKEFVEYNLYHNKVTLYYSVRSKYELIALDELQALASKSNGRFSVVPWVSSEKGRISLDYIDIPNNNVLIYLCGSVPFKNSLMKQFHGIGISKNQIYDEEFVFK